MVEKLNKKDLAGYALFLLVAPFLLGLGTTAMSIQCQPANAAVGQRLSHDNLKTALPTAVPVMGMNCGYYTDLFFGLWPKTRGSVSNVQAMFTPKDSTSRGAATKAIELKLGGGMQSVQVLGFTPSKIDANVVEAFNQKLAAGVAFHQKTLLFTHGTVITSVIAAVIFWLPMLVLWAAPPSSQIQQAKSTWAAWRQHWQRTGSDSSYINFGLFAVPAWIGLVVAFIAVCLTAAYFDDWLPNNAKFYIPGSGPGLLGLIDLLNRLRTTHYILPTALGLSVTRQTSAIDRLTFAECGWYMPFFGAPVPLWLIGAGLTVVLIRM